MLSYKNGLWCTTGTAEVLLLFLLSRRELSSTLSSSNHTLVAADDARTVRCFSASMTFAVELAALLCGLSLTFIDGTCLDVLLLLPLLLPLPKS